MGDSYDRSNRKPANSRKKSLFWVSWISCDNDTQGREHVVALYTICIFPVRYVAPFLCYCPLSYNLSNSVYLPIGIGIVVTTGKCISNHRDFR